MSHAPTRAPNLSSCTGTTDFLCAAADTICAGRVGPTSMLLAATRIRAKCWQYHPDGSVPAQLSICSTLYQAFFCLDCLGCTWLFGGAHPCAAVRRFTGTRHCASSIIQPTSDGYGSWSDTRSVFPEFSAVFDFCVCLWWFTTSSGGHAANASDATDVDAVSGSAARRDVPRPIVSTRSGADATGLQQWPIWPCPLVSARSCLFSATSDGPPNYCYKFKTFVRFRGACCFHATRAVCAATIAPAACTLCAPAIRTCALQDRKSVV